MVPAFCADQTGNAKWRFARRTRRGEQMKDDWIEVERCKTQFVLAATIIEAARLRRRPSWSRAR